MQSIPSLSLLLVPLKHLIGSYLWVNFELTKKRSRRYPAKTITDADYADDIAILANTPNQVETLLQSLEQAAEVLGNAEYPVIVFAVSSTQASDRVLSMSQLRADKADTIAGVLQGDTLAPIPLYHLSRLRA